jgi:hypothetical protein
MNLIQGLISLILGLFLTAYNIYRGEYLVAVVTSVFILLGINLLKKSKHIRKGSFKPKDWEK